MYDDDDPFIGGASMFTYPIYRLMSHVKRNDKHKMTGGFVRT